MGDPRRTKAEKRAEAAIEAGAEPVRLSVKDVEKVSDLALKVMAAPDEFGPMAQVYTLAEDGDEESASWCGEFPREQIGEAAKVIATLLGPGPTGVYLVHLVGPKGAGFKGKAHVRVTADLRPPKPPPVAAPVAPQSTTGASALDRDALILDALRGLNAKVQALEAKPAEVKPPDEVDKLERLANMMTNVLGKVPGGPGDQTSTLDAFKLGVQAGEKGNTTTPWYAPTVDKYLGEAIGSIKDGTKLGWKLLKEYKENQKKEEEAKKKKAAAEAEKKKAEARAAAEAAAAANGEGPIEEDEGAPEEQVVQAS